MFLTFSFLSTSTLAANTSLAQLDELEKPQIPPSLNSAQVPTLKTPNANTNEKVPGIILHLWPVGITVDLYGNVFVSVSNVEDHPAESRMIKYTSNGVYIKSWGHYGLADGQFRYSTGVDVDPAGHVFVADVLNDRIQKFDNNGVFMKSWNTVDITQGWGPEDVSVDSSSGNVFVADTDNNRIGKYTSNGDFVAVGGQSGDGLGKFNRPISIAIDTEGNMFVSDINERIQWFKLDNHCRAGQIELWSGICFVTSWGTPGTGIGQFHDPHGIAVDHAGHVFVVDQYNQRIQKFKLANPCPKGAKQVTPGICFVTMWGTKGTGNGQFSYPSDVAVDPYTGSVFIADYSNGRIQKFTNNGVFISKWYAPTP